MLQEFVQKIEDTARSVVNEIHTALPGRIEEFNPDTGLATVLPSGKFKTTNGKMIDYPAITGVPVLFPQSASLGVYIAFPVSQGDDCLIIISEQELDAWLYDGVSENDLRFDLTNAIAIPGLSNKGSVALTEACNDKSIVILNSSAKVKVEKTQVSISLGDTQICVCENGIAVRGDLNVTGNIISTGSIKSGNIDLKEHTHTSGEASVNTSKPK